MIIDCVSDLHGDQPYLAGGDVLIVAGDLTISHMPEEFKRFFDWLIEQDYKHKIVIGGNHDSYLQRNVMYGQISMNLGKQYDKHDNFIGYGYYYLCEASVMIEGIKFFGTPWTRTFKGISPNCMAFTVDGEEMLSKKWVVIPEDTDVLITHSPPHGVFDEVKRYKAQPESVGSVSLLNVVGKIKPKLHVFGHIHSGYGHMIQEWPPYDGKNKTIYVNASIMNEDYEPVNQPIRIEI